MNGDIPKYIKSAAKVAQPKLREMRALVAAAAPGARQELKWGMPTFSYKRILVSFDEPLPKGLIRKIVRARLRALKERDARWRTPD